MKPALFVPVMLSIATPSRQPNQSTPVLVVSRDARGVLRGMPCARFDLSDPQSFLSDDTVRAKRCVKPEAQTQASSRQSLKK